MGKWLLFIIMAGAGGFSLYMAFWAWRAGQSSVWFFLTISVFLLIPVAAHLISPAPGRINSSPQQTRFVPHWFMMGAVIILGLCVLVTILFIK